MTLFLLGFTLSANNFSNGVSAYNSGDKQKAVKLWSKACDDNDMDGCFILGLMYYDGEGVIQNKQKAVKLYTKACDSNFMRACLNLGILYVTGDGVRQNKRIAKELFAKACDGGLKLGCNLVN